MSLTFREKLVKLVEEKSVVFGVQEKDPQVLSFRVIDLFWSMEMVR